MSRVDCSLEARAHRAIHRSPPALAARTQAMATAGARWLADDWAIEIARNVATVAHLDEQDGIPCDVIDVAREAIVHRMQAFGMACSDAYGAAFAMGCAWREAGLLERYRSHCRRTADLDGETTADHALQMAAVGAW